MLHRAASGATAGAEREAAVEAEACRVTDSVTTTSTGNFGTSGFVFGGTVGANYQVGSLVFGVEADGDWADASGFGTFTASSLCAGGCLTTSSWLSTLRGRAGYAFDRFFVYGTGGAAFGNVRPARPQP